jgi:hypothetical protein
MRILTSCLLVAGLCNAQTFYVPDNQANAGTCNVIPFGSTTSSSSFYTCLMQQMYTAADLNNQAGLITGLEFAPCGNGASRFNRLQVVFDLLPAGSTLSATFANNVTPTATTVLDTTNYVWQTTSNTWMEIGLQVPFVYDGVSDLVVQILSDGGTSPAGFHRSATRPRVYATNWTGSPPPSGTLSLTTGQKLGISMLVAKASLYGEGCIGTNGQRPGFALSGSPQLGQTQNLDLARAPANGIAFLVAGFGNGAPFPAELGSLGMPGCYQYFSPISTQLGLTDGSGTALSALAVPGDPSLAGVLIYAQWACLDLGANALGITTSDYARILLGN